LVCTNWAAIERVAAALFAWVLLTQDELDAVIGTAVPIVQVPPVAPPLLKVLRVSCEEYLKARG
jgi:hypothetical protein